METAAIVGAGTRFATASRHASNLVTPYVEVDVENDRVVALYTLVGFESVATEDYCSLTMR